MLNLFNRVIPFGHILFCSNLFGDAIHMNIDLDHFTAGKELSKPTMIKRISYSEIIMQTNREWKMSLLTFGFIIIKVRYV